MNEILKYDSEFTESKFITYINNIFVQVHLAIVTKELENIKHFVSDDLYDKLTQKVNKLNEQNLIQMYDEINVAQTDILNYHIDNNTMIIEVNIVSRYLDYLIDSNGNYKSGNMETRMQKNNHLVFTKKINFKQSQTVNRCPNCGASIDVNLNGKCPYCGTIYNLEDKNWILSSLEN